jgi:hypothetical protein
MFLRALGAIMGDVFHSHRDGYRFSRLACDLVEKYGFVEYQVRVYLAMSLAAPRNVRCAPASTNQ